MRLNRFVGLRIEESLYAQIAALAKLQQVPESVVMRLALERHCDVVRNERRSIEFQKLFY